MELSEFRRRYHDSQNRFYNSLQAFTTAIEIVAANNPQNRCTINQTVQIISEYAPQVLTNYENLTAIVDEFFNSQPPPKQLMEGAAGVAIAAFLKKKE